MIARIGRPLTEGGATVTTAKIIVGYDTSPESRAAGEWALDEAKRTGASVEFLYAYEWPSLKGTRTTRCGRPDSTAR